MIHNHSGTENLNFKVYPEKTVIATWIKLACQNQMSAALWRLPGRETKHLAVDFRESLVEGKIDLEESAGGFLLAPFDNPDRSREMLIKADIYFNTYDNQLVTSDHTGSSKSTQLLEQFKAEISRGILEPTFFIKNNGETSTSASGYQQVVTRALENITSGRFQKVVPAVIRKVALSREFNCLDTFYKLCDSYPNAFVSMVSAKGIGTWIGASPEALIEVGRSQMFSTVAVAGTQALQPGLAPQEVAWRQKEIEEQALVSRYIINCFKKIRLREFEEIGPKTVVAGNLLHLKTTFTVDMEETNFPLLGSVMLDLLHPTSAVCGMPKATAQQFLKENEDFDRELFSGYLGPVNINKDTNLFVNLRCMQIQPDHALLYAGAGVTEDSIPEKEWKETQLKCDTLLEVMDQ